MRYCLPLRLLAHPLLHQFTLMALQDYAEHLSDDKVRANLDQLGRVLAAEALAGTLVHAGSFETHQRYMQRQLSLHRDNDEAA